MGLEFGSFNSICENAALILCPLVGTDHGISPSCYSRNVDVGGTLLFQPSTLFVHVVAIIMTAIMIYHIRTKYTAVGRKEIIMFFWIYLVIQLLGIFLDTEIIPAANAAYPWFAAAYIGFISAAYCCILLNGFVGFQFAEDGTALSLWILRISCLVLFAVGFFVSIATFKNIAGFSFAKPIALWIVFMLWPLVCVPVYIISQLILVFRTLEDRWPIGDIFFGTSFYVVGMVLLFAFSATICDAIVHYLDGLFFQELCVLLAVMMVYKYWDSITKEDLEFSVGSKQAVWEVKDPLLAEPDDEPSGYNPSGNYGGYSQAPSIITSNYGGYGGGKTASLVGGMSGAQLYQHRGGGGGGGGYGPPRGAYPPSGGGY